ncbi:MAG: four helix bundle protein [Dehalococcoidales bacterium]|jgi:four helix bundle protein|nr:four helix bundle protein [Dehalococcoidales bacterium]
MAKVSSAKHYDLEERTLSFAKEVIAFVNILPKTMANLEISKQVIRSSGSVGANYIEANEALGKKDFAMRIKICRKEAKESIYWLRLIEARGEEAEKRKQSLISEATELMKIFGAILGKTLNPKS